MRAHIPKFVTTTLKWPTTTDEPVTHSSVTMTYGKYAFPLCGRGAQIADDPRNADCRSCWRLLNAHRARSHTERDQ